MKYLFMLLSDLKKNNENFIFLRKFFFKIYFVWKFKKSNKILLIF